MFKKSLKTQKHSNKKTLMSSPLALKMGQKKKPKKKPRCDTNLGPFSSEPHAVTIAPHSMEKLEKNLLFIVFAGFCFGHLPAKDRVRARIIFRVQYSHMPLYFYISRFLIGVGNLGTFPRKSIFNSVYFTRVYYLVRSLIILIGISTIRVAELSCELAWAKSILICRLNEFHLCTIWWFVRKLLHMLTFRLRVP